MARPGPGTGRRTSRRQASVKAGRHVVVCPFPFDRQTYSILHHSIRFWNTLLPANQAGYMYHASLAPIRIRCSCRPAPSATELGTRAGQL
jgi:hypothetical protein